MPEIIEFKTVATNNNVISTHIPAYLGDSQEIIVSTVYIRELLQENLLNMTVWDEEENILGYVDRWELVAHNHLILYGIANNPYYDILPNEGLYINEDLYRGIFDYTIESTSTADTTWASLSRVSWPEFVEAAFVYTNSPNKEKEKDKDVNDGNTNKKVIEFDENKVPWED